MEKKINKEINIKNIHYNILGFNQITVLACQKIIKKKVISLNIIDLCILKWFMNLCLEKGKNNKYIHINPKDNLEYQQIDYSMCIKAFPILNVKKQTIALIFKKLCNLHIVQHYCDRRGGTFSCYRLNTTMMWILLQPEKKEEYTPEILNKKLYTLYKILGNGLYNIIDGSILLYRPNILLNNNIDNNTIEILSKDNKASFKDAKIITLSEDTIKYIKYWNVFKNTNKLLFTHILKENNPSKTILLINKYFRFLKKGLINKYVQLDQEFLKRNNINNTTINYKYENNIIYKILNRLADLYNSNYWPPNKNNLPRSLSGLIYNPKTGSSFFLKIAQEIFDGKETQSSIIQHINKYPEVIEKYSKFIKEDSNTELTPAQVHKLNSYIKIFIDFQKNTVKKYKKIYKDTNFSIKIGTDTNPIPFFITHLKWAKEKIKKCPSFHPLIIINPYNAFWDSFIKDLKKEEKIDLTLKDATVKRRENHMQLKNKLEEKNKILEKKQKEQQFFAEI